MENPIRRVQLCVLPCGCKIISITNGREIKGHDIDYCPKHKAAPDMYEALKELLIAYKALAKAKGGE